MTAEKRSNHTIASFLNEEMHCNNLGEFCIDLECHNNVIGILRKTLKKEKHNLCTSIDWDIFIRMLYVLDGFYNV